MNQVEKNQMKMNERIGAAISTDNQTAFMYASNVKRLLTVSVSENLFESLVNLCHSVGVDNFSNSIALKMANAKASEANIKKMVKRTTNNFN